MSIYLDTVTIEGFHFRKEGKGGSHNTALPEALPGDAFGASWDPETLTLTYYTPNEPDEQGNPVDPTEAQRVFTQQEIDDAQESIFGFNLDRAKENKKLELKEARDAAWTGELMTSFGIPFKTDVQTQLDISFMTQNLAPLEVFNGYKCADGVRRDITREQFQQALGEGITRKVTAYAVEGAKLAELDALPSDATQVDVDAIMFE